ncbi:phytoene/squalene synthase family protein [Brevibacterium zhoupengii]|uniref:phytoene/squalene synthase family protein n=1 Tax=Brevibacterium zhoupengii TaxID=2898795 RepID=UPI001E35186F|nr:squalene/phytoene synthase family protein [Brevibacterium zhoupengii]
MVPKTHELFSHTAQQVAEAVISNYSTSFGLATRLLGPTHRHHIRNIYALVRIADEIVDGLAAEAGLDAGEQRELLDNFAAATRSALRFGISDNLVIHAFAQTARTTGITFDLIEPFFASMRADLGAASESLAPVRGLLADEHRDYVYGSAEVVGLMCLNVFLNDQVRTPAEVEALEFGARQLGAAFQNINFLRDLADDSVRLHRSYLTTESRLSDSDKTAWVIIIREQLAHAQATFSLLPKDARTAVRSAAALFAALNDRIAVTPVDRLYQERVRIPNAVKARLASQAILATAREGRT